MKKIVLIFLFFLSFFGFSQDDNSDLINKNWVEVVLNNGRTYIAKIISDDGREILLDTKEIGKLYVKKTEINTIKNIKDEKNIVYGEYREEGPFTTRYFLTPNALPVKKGENYAYIHLLGPELHFAITDRTSIGVFTSWIASPFGVVFKHNLPTKNEKLNFSVGALASSLTYINSFKGYGTMVFASGTYGNRMSNISVSLGYSLFNTNLYKRYNVDFIDTTYSYNFKYGGYVDYKRPLSHSFLSSIAGVIKVSAKTSFFAEIWFTASSVKKPANIQYTDANFGYNNYTYNYYDDFFSFPFFNNLKVNNYYPIPNYLQRYIRYTIMFFPGIKILLRNNKAFQITLGSVHHFDNGKATSFPLPMLSWYKKF